jgi:hypothetical protein
MLKAPKTAASEHWENQRKKFWKNYLHNRGRSYCPTLDRAREILNGPDPGAGFAWRSWRKSHV